MDESYETVRVSREDSAVVLTLDRIDDQNSLSSQLVTDLSSALEAADQDSVRSIIITGQEGVFCGGADISEFSFNGSKTAKGKLFGERGFQEPFKQIESHDKPVISAVNGTALGGGFELALVSDLAIVGNEVSMGLPEVKIGAVPAIALLRLADSLDHHSAMELMLTGKQITGSEAVSKGLFNEAVPGDEVLTRAVEYSQTFESVAPVAVTIAKKIATRHRRERDSAISDFGLGILMETDDIREGTEAFFEKRAPEFEDS